MPSNKSSNLTKQSNKYKYTEKSIPMDCKSNLLINPNDHEGDCALEIWSTTH